MANELNPDELGLSHVVIENGAAKLAAAFEALLEREIAQLESESRHGGAESARSAREQLAEAKFVKSLWGEAKLASGVKL